MVNLIALNLARAEIKVNCFVAFSRFERGNRSGEAESEERFVRPVWYGKRLPVKREGSPYAVRSGTMVRVSADDGFDTVYLFGEDGAHQNVRECQPAERKKQIGLLARGIQVPVGAAYQKAYFRAAGKHPVFNNAGEFRTGYVFAAFVKDDDFGAGSYAGLEKTRFVLLRGVVFFADV